LIAVNILIFFAWQSWFDTTDEEKEAFLYERAAIACEIRSGDPLTNLERASGECGVGDPNSTEFEDKDVLLAAVVSMFLHGGILHLLGNMWFLWIFGNNVEEAFGSLGYLLMYLAAGIAATAAFVFANLDSTEPLVGASGAIAGVLGAYLVLFPKHQVLSLVFFFFVPVPALVFLGIWFVSQFAISDVSVAWEAHVAGFVFGVLVTLPFRRVLLTRIANLHATARFR
jgi:membrane associated rhomboid family serine protease